MAYSDTRTLFRFHPASMGGALAINGVLIAGLVLLKPDVLPPEIFTPIDILRTDPPEPVEATIERHQPIPQPGAVSQKPDQTQAKPQASETQLALGNDGDIATSGGTGSTAIIDPIDIEPVFRIARLDPRYAGVVQPAYPPGLVRNEVEGAVTVKVLVGIDGRVKAVETVTASEPAFLTATRKQALAKWRFLPATRDGEPVESWREMTVRFVLPD